MNDLPLWDDDAILPDEGPVRRRSDEPDAEFPDDFAEPGKPIDPSSADGGFAGGGIADGEQPAGPYSEQEYTEQEYTDQEAESEQPAEEPLVPIRKLPISRRLILTASTAAILTGWYALFAIFVTPLLSPVVMETRRQHEVGRIDNTRPRENRQMAQRWLASHPWAADAAYQARTANTFIYAETWEPVKQTGEIRFKPFAVILVRESEPGKEEAEPLVVAAESALLRFAEKLDFDKPNPQLGRLVGGVLEGAVTIRGDNNLSVEGRNFVFSEAACKVTSDHPVSFTHGMNRGQGIGLELDLIPGTGPVDPDKPHISGIRTVRLVRDVVMHLTSDTLAKQEDPQQADRKVENVRIKCAGQFEYLIEGHVATFQNQVDVLRPTGNEQYDNLQCDLLTLIFESTPKAGDPAVAAATPPGTPAAPAAPPVVPPVAPPATPVKGALGDNLTFRRMRAEGKEVLLSSQRSDFRARMAELTYDMQNRVVALRDAKQVQVVQALNDIQCPEITVVHDQPGKIVSVVCRGAGRFNSYAADKQQPGVRGPLAFSAEWLRQLRKYPDPETGLDIVEFEQQALLSQPGQMVLEGNIVKIWLTPDGQRTLSGTPDTGDEKGQPVQPKRLLALDKVAFASPEVVGETERLEIWFEEGRLADMPRPQAAVRSRFRLQPTALRRAVPQTVPGRQIGFMAVDDRLVAQVPAQNVSRGPNQSPPPATPRAPREAKPPMHVSADLIRVRTLRHDNKTEVAEIWNEGKVKVTQARDPGEPPMSIDGDRLHLLNYPDDKQIVQVVGTPAHIRDRGMEIEGADINLDRGRNFAHVDGAGVLRMPVKQSLDGKALKEAQMLDVWWKEQMQFDGHIARFFVDVRATMGENRMSCQEMHVTLSDRVSFSQKEMGEQKAEISMIFCQDTVDVENFEYKENRLTGIQRAHAFEFTLNQLTGDTTASGPGTLTFWRRGNGKRAGFSPTAAVQANKPLQTEQIDWEYTRIDFAGNMRGNMKQRKTSFFERVRIVYGPVNRSTDVIDEDHLPKDGGWMRCDRLDLHQHKQTTTTDGYVDMMGTGNSELDGRTAEGSFHALADVISYDQSKGLYVLRSAGTRKATIWRQEKAGAPTSHNVAQRMEFNPSLRTLKLDRGYGLDGLN